MPDIHAIVLTRDEEKHIARCLRSLTGHCASVTVVDSGSNDRTVEIATSLGATVLTNPWLNYATQMNFAIDTLAGRGGWLLRIDADEVLDEDSAETLGTAISAAGDAVDGLLIQRRIHFMGRRIRYGGIEPNWQLRLWRNGRGRCEKRWMDEHIKVSGQVVHSSVILSDINLNSLTWWIAKHNSYASREAIDVLMRSEEIGSGAGTQARIRRFLKNTIFYFLPGGLRSVLYFIYRYVFCLGFLDGRQGWYFHTLQGYWYRSLVDAKLAEIRARISEGISVVDAIEASTGIRLDVKNTLDTISINAQRSKSIR